MRLLITCLLTAATATGAVCARVPAPAVVPASGDLKQWTMAFIRDKDIWTAKGDGSGQHVIIKNAGTPCWSPNHKRLAFYRDGNVWVADADGKNQQQITHFKNEHPSFAEDFRISWDRKTGIITFTRPTVITVKSAADGKSSQVDGRSILDIDPSAKKPVPSVRFDATDTGTSFSFADNDNPAWSRSGNSLAFTRDGDIWLAEFVPKEDEDGRDGWDISRLSAVAEYDSPTWRVSRTNLGVTALSWGPNEEHLAYCLNRLDGTGVSSLHVITFAKDGLKDKVLLEEFSPGLDGMGWEPDYACYSPDGKWIAFTSGRTIYAISSDGKQVSEVVKNGYKPVW